MCAERNLPMRKFWRLRRAPTKPAQILRAGTGRLWKRKRLECNDRPAAVIGSPHRIMRVLRWMCDGAKGPPKIGDAAPGEMVGAGSQRARALLSLPAALPHQSRPSGFLLHSRE